MAKHSTKLINPHGRTVDVVNARVDGLLKQGYTRAPDDSVVPTPKSEDGAGEASPSFTSLEEQLDALTKPKIAEFAMAEYSLELNPNSYSKDEMIAAVLDAVMSEGGETSEDGTGEEE